MFKEPQVKTLKEGEKAATYNARNIYESGYSMSLSLTC